MLAQNSTHSRVFWALTYLQNSTCLCCAQIVLPCIVFMLCTAVLEGGLPAQAPACFGCCGGAQTKGECEQTAHLGDFPQDEKLWEGGEFKFCGSAIRYKKILFISIQARRQLSCHASRRL